MKTKIKDKNGKETECYSYTVLGFIRREHHKGPLKHSFGFDWEAEDCSHCGKEVSFRGFDVR